MYCASASYGFSLFSLFRSVVFVLFAVVLAIIAAYRRFKGRKRQADASPIEVLAVMMLYPVISSYNDVVPHHSTFSYISRRYQCRLQALHP